MQSPLGKERLDLEAVLGRVAGDTELLKELVSVFAEDAPVKLAALNEALESEDMDKVSRSAHSIKGAAGAVGAEKARSLALDLEMAAKDDKADAVSDIARRLAEEIEEVVEAIGKL